MINITYNMRYLKKLLLLVLAAFVLSASGVSYGAEDRENEYPKHDTVDDRSYIHIDELSGYFNKGDTVKNRKIIAKDIITLIGNHTYKLGITNRTNHAPNDNSTNKDTFAVRIDNSSIKGTIGFNNILVDDCIINNTLLSIKDKGTIYKQAIDLNINQNIVNKLINQLIPHNADNGTTVVPMYVVNVEISITNSEITPNHRTEYSIDAENIVFSKKVDFHNTLFNNTAYFKNDVFVGDAIFNKAIFHELSIFSQCIFNNKANYIWSIFHGITSFSSAVFMGTADFTLATFKDQVGFVSTIFYGDAIFYIASFHSAAYFEDTRFLKMLKMESSTFYNYADFHNSLINQLNMNSSLLKPIIFDDRFDLRNSIIREAYFGDIIFKKGADFSNACFGVHPEFIDYKTNAKQFQPCIEHIGIGKKKPNLIKWDNVTFIRSSIFENNANFIRTAFLGGVYFDSISFEKELDFTEAVFGDKSVEEPIILKAYDLIRDIYYDIARIALTIIGEGYANYVNDIDLYKILKKYFNKFEEIIPAEIGKFIANRGKDLEILYWSIMDICSSDAKVNRYMFSYLNFNKIKLKFHQLPRINEWSIKSSAIRESFANKNAITHIEPISESLRKFQEGFKSFGADSSANKAAYAIFKSKCYDEDLRNDYSHNDNIIGRDRRAIVKIGVFLHVDQIVSMMKMIFLGIPSCYGRDLGRLVIFSLIILFSFTFAYMNDKDFCHKCCDKYGDGNAMCNKKIEDNGSSWCNTIHRKKSHSHERNKFSLRLFQFPVIVDFDLHRYVYKGSVKSYKCHMDLLIKLIEFSILFFISIGSFLLIIYKEPLVGILLVLITFILFYVIKYCSINKGSKQCEKVNDPNPADESGEDNSKNQKVLYEKIELLFKECFSDAFLLSLVLLFKIGYGNTEVKSSSLYVLIYIEWLLGYIIYIHLLYTLKNTVPFVGAFLDKLI
ncbi:MAG: pentapeptide repeat-containing protein [Nitrospirae bacterium]|nr:pentapeptide repeat-containing protein [Nitrospirota bacterium]